MSSRVRDNHSQVLKLTGGRRVGLGVYGARKGIPVLALHGTPASRFMFEIADEPAARLGLTLYCPERPGYGLSDSESWDSESDDGLSRRTDELLEIVDKLGLERFLILGISGGAPFAVSLACRLGRRARGLALVSPMGPVADLPENLKERLTLKHRFLFQNLVRWPFVARAFSGLGAGVFRFAPRLSIKLFAWSLGRADNKVLSQDFASHSLIRMTHEAVRAGAFGLLSDLRVFSLPWNVAYKALRAPAILWIGQEDRLVPVVSARWLGEVLPGCEVVSIKQAGHFWVYEKVGDVLGDLANLADE